MIKFDFATGRSEKFSFGQNRFGGESIFVAAAKPSAEDHGYLLNFIYDKNTNQGEALIMSAGDLKSPVLARILLPRRVPYGLHGAWLPGIDHR